MATDNNKSGNPGFIMKNIPGQPESLGQNGDGRGERNNFQNPSLSDNTQTKNINAGGIGDPSRTEEGSNDSPTNNSPTPNDGLLPTTTENGTIGLLDTFVGGHTGEDALKAFTLYRNKKLLTQSLMDIALFSANASQLRHVLVANDGLAITYVCMGLLITSIVLQVLTGLALLLSTQYNVTICEERKMAFKLGNYVIIGIFLITVVNVFISAFGGPP